ncbi:hypothetical protein CFIMG_004017RA [Ceratocystis fimbriata CBS 114723]|uniref:Uncharacterized protein n=1 Tax=Ceratocystis fimbriata CBS 114723 TaxID=1035309 RepID=A0A2C5X0M6_9PEZI|nr:hypothetical protein CFIMG_004017RA [Ceratocystis fimbriata CBS 114723]
MLSSLVLKWCTMIGHPRQRELAMALFRDLGDRAAEAIYPCTVAIVVAMHPRDGVNCSSGDVSDQTHFLQK